MMALRAYIENCIKANMMRIHNVGKLIFRLPYILVVSSSHVLSSLNFDGFDYITIIQRWRFYIHEIDIHFEL